jgi:hypothetical protein
MTPTARAGSGASTLRFEIYDVKNRPINRHYAIFYLDRQPLRDAQARLIGDTTIDRRLIIS